MADLCMCGHEEREHAYDPTESRPVCFGNAMACPCARYRRSPLSAFRGPAVRMSREEAAGWLRALGRYWEADRIEFSRLMPSDWRSMLRLQLDLTRTRRALGSQDGAVCTYLAARILRAVRP